MYENLGMCKIPLYIKLHCTLEMVYAINTETVPNTKIAIRYGTLSDFQNFNGTVLKKLRYGTIQYGTEEVMVGTIRTGTRENK